MGTQTKKRTPMVARTMYAFQSYRRATQDMPSCVRPHLFGVVALGNSLVNVYNSALRGFAFDPLKLFQYDVLMTPSFRSHTVDWPLRLLRGRSSIALNGAML